MKINKTRIVNLNYNDGKRTIYNECFDYKNGKNTLFSMDNGLGKTVIIQFMLQPFLRRNRDLAKRDFASYFKGPNPVYVMHELLLDDNSKLLIGCLMKGDKNNEDKNRVKISAFINHYEFENEYDIEHIPLIQTINGKNQIVSFFEAETMLKNASKTIDNIEFYNFDDNVQKKKYFYFLEQYGINSKEWESLIKKINQEESGLSELFSNCETTPELLKKQLIPIIDEKLKVSEDRIEGLQQHAKKYINIYLEHKQEIQKATSYQKFLSEINELDEEFDDYEKAFNKLENSQTFLKKLHVSINNQIENKDSNQDDFLHVIAEKEKEIKNIQIQKISYNANIQKEQIDDLSDEINDYNIQKEELTNSIKEFKKNMSIQECAKHYERLIQKKNSLFGLEETLKSNKLDDNELIDFINNMKYTLANLYNEKLKEISLNIENIEKTLLDKKELKEKTKNILQELKEKSNKCNEIITANNITIKNFLNKEENLKNNDKLYNDIFEKNSNLSKKEIVNLYIDKLLEEENRISLDNKKLSNEFSMLKENINDSNVRLEEQRNLLSDEKNKLYQNESLMTQYKDNETKIYNIINKYDYKEISQKIVSDVKTYLSNESKKYLELQKQYLSSISLSENLLINLENNQLFNIDKKLIDILNENNISFMYGFDWIKNKGPESKEDKILLLRKNPLIPYSLILLEEGYEMIQKLNLSNIDINALPIFTPETINTIDNKVMSQYTNELNNIKYLNSFNIDFISENKYSEHINKIKIRLDEERNNLEKNEEYLSIINNDLSILNSMDYNEKQYLHTKQKILEIKEEINKINLEIFNLKKEIEDKSTDLELIDIKMTENKRFLLSVASKRENCVNISSLSDDYEFAYNQNERTEKEYNNVQKEISTLNNSLNKTEEELHKKNIEKIEVSNLYKLIDAEYGKIKDSEGHLIAWDNSMEELKNTIETMENKLSKDITSIQSDIESIQDDISYLNKDINTLENRYSLKLEDYNNTSYNEELYNHYEELIYSKESDIEDIDDKVSSLNHDLIVSESKYDDKLEELRELGINKIIDNVQYYDFDLKLDNLTSELKKLEETNSNSLKLYESYTNCLSKIKKYLNNSEINDDTLKPITNIEDLKNSIDLLDDKLMTISDLKDVLNKKENNIRYVMNNYCRNYAEIEEQLNLILADTNVLSIKNKLDIFKESLKDLLNYLELTTKNIYDEEMFVINEAIEYACSVYSEIIQIDKKSKILVNGKNKQMLQIKVPLENELNKENVEYYVRGIINDIIENYQDIDIEKVLATQLKSINLFEKLVNGFSSVKVYIYKIEKHSLIKKEWKEINSENSGGEQFVSVFILFISLLAYMRNNNSNDNEGKVLIMDNPFAKTNAEHLLIPMFDIAKKFNTQLICFSGIGGSSVYNRFDVIYASKIIKDKYRENEILEFNKNDQETPEAVELLGISIEEKKKQELETNKMIL